MANETGKRYVCASCGSEMLVTRGGDGTVSCCGQPMQPRAAAQAPSQPASERSGPQV
jgi:desulfoferrodoxin-like iron-binding protein